MHMGNPRSNFVFCLIFFIEIINTEMNVLTYQSKVLYSNKRSNFGLLSVKDFGSSSRSDGVWRSVWLYFSPHSLSFWDYGVLQLFFCTAPFICST